MSVQPVMFEFKYIEFCSSATVIKPPSLDPEFTSATIASITSLCLLLTIVIDTDSWSSSTKELVFLGLKYIFSVGIDTIREKELSLAKVFYEGIRDIPKIKIYGDFNSFYRSPIVTINLEGVPSSDLAEVLSFDYGIATRSGIHCAPLMHNDFKTNESGMVRFSFSHYNTMEEILKTIEILKNISQSI